MLPVRKDYRNPIVLIPHEWIMEKVMGVNVTIYLTHLLFLDIKQL
jgi:hypothetical protein